MRTLLAVAVLALGVGVLAGCSSSSEAPAVIKADKERTPPPDQKAKTQPPR